MHEHFSCERQQRQVHQTVHGAPNTVISQVRPSTRTSSHSHTLSYRLDIAKPAFYDGDAGKNLLKCTHRRCLQVGHSASRGKDMDQFSMVLEDCFVVVGYTGIHVARLKHFTCCNVYLPSGTKPRSYLFKQITIYLNK